MEARRRQINVQIRILWVGHELIEWFYIKFVDLELIWNLNNLELIGSLNESEWWKNKHKPRVASATKNYVINEIIQRVLNIPISIS